jgi:transcriptional/translational regulatory protein YebC/TACO1
VGEIEVNIEGLNLEDIEMKFIESGAEDFEIANQTALVYSRISDLKNVKEKLEKENLLIVNAQLVFMATQKNEVSDMERKKYEILLEKLDENDDVVEIYDNLK